MSITEQIFRATNDLRDMYGLELYRLTLLESLSNISMGLKRISCLSMDI